MFSGSSIFLMIRWSFTARLTSSFNMRFRPGNETLEQRLLWPAITPDVFFECAQTVAEEFFASFMPKNLDRSSIPLLEYTDSLRRTCASPDPDPDCGRPGCTTRNAPHWYHKKSLRPSFTGIGRHLVPILLKSRTINNIVVTLKLNLGKNPYPATSKIKYFSTWIEIYTILIIILIF